MKIKIIKKNRDKGECSRIWKIKIERVNQASKNT